MKKLKYIMGSLVLLIVVGLFMLTNPVISCGAKELQTDTSLDKRLEEHILFMTEIDPPRNHSHINSLDSVANYVANIFKESGARVEHQEYLVDTGTYRNVIGSFGPEDGPRIIVGAHYDVYGEMPGADDNASGTAGLIELARLIGERKPKLEYRVDLVAYTLEEPPYFRSDQMGSAVHAKSIYEDSVEVVGMICLEMIGYYTDEKKSQKYPFGAMKTVYPSVGNYIAVIGKMGQGSLVRSVKKSIIKGSEIDVISLSAPESMGGIDLSDHRNYWAYDYDAVMVTNTAFYRNDNYHQHSDTQETLDYLRMAEVVKGVYNAVINLD